MADPIHDPVHDPMSDPKPDPTVSKPDPTLEPNVDPATVSPNVPSEVAPNSPANAPAIVAGNVAASKPQITEFSIGEEFGTAKRNLPPAGIVLICIAVIAIVIGIFAFKGRAKPQGSGSIDFVSAVEVPNQNMILVAITINLHNTAEKPLWIRTLKAQLQTSDGKDYEDEAASAVDLDRYYQNFPPLKESSEAAIPPETKIPGGTSQKGTIVVSFPISKEAIDQRKSLSVTIQPYDQPLPIVLK
jgi:hypothetical protein